VVDEHLSWLDKRFRPESILRPETRIRKQVDAIERMLGLRYRARVLDLGCGRGAQTIEFARRRYRILGMDQVPKAFAEAKEVARDERLTVHFVAEDTTRIRYENEFNAVINLRNPIGIHKTEKDDLHCMQGACRSLRAGGKVLLDLINRERVLRSLGPQSKALDLRTGRLDSRHFSTRGGTPGGWGMSIRLYSLTEVRRLLDEAGLVVREVFGNYELKPYTVDSPRLLIVADAKPVKKKLRQKVEDMLPRALRIKGRPRR